VMEATSDAEVQVFLSGGTPAAPVFGSDAPTVVALAAMRASKPYIAPATMLLSTDEAVDATTGAVFARRSSTSVWRRWCPSTTPCTATTPACRSTGTSK
jgi:hypothetical protein